MHSALFVAKLTETSRDWATFLMKAKVGLRTYPGVSRLAENVWLVNLQETPAPLAYLVSAADGLGVPYGILPFEHACLNGFRPVLIPRPFGSKVKRHNLTSSLFYLF